MTVYIGEAEWLCEDCGIEAGLSEEDSYPDCGETDCPENCARCHRPLEYSLTGEGVTYVMEHLDHEVAKWNLSPSKAMGEWKAVHDCYKGTWYEGSPWIVIMRDWAEELGNYGLDDADEHVVEMFLTLTLCAVKD